MNEENIKQELHKNDELNKKIETKFQSWIDEYTEIIKELALKRDQITNEIKNEQSKILQQEQLEIKLEPIDEEMKIIKEELKQLNPNYTRAQKRIKQTNENKIPELISIPA
ncbi:hypothetical protein [Maize bushy stunt phytoplasma]|uniref:hypothetical protein n=1 Tax=Maize bushy stunt phytoplasma TaxID=202462 RepID=UPI002A4E27BE|nr:hypothetical protein [Maize bushy stunt phytoplasma]